jgi:diguanylate cyclase
MTSSYETESKLLKMAPVLDDHAEWYGQAVRRIFYPDQYRNDGPLERPDSFAKWLSEVEPDDYIEKTVLQSLQRVHDELHDVASKVIISASKGAKPDIRLFDSFEDLYEGFAMQLRRLQRDLAQADSGLDPLSGLRTRKAMTIELERELERRARRGRPFSLALAKIDDYERIRGLIDDNHHKQILATLGRLIRKCIRSFDDGYRSGEVEFTMSLKHADTTGGTAAINRLRNFLEQEKLVIPDGQGGTFPLTMSYCVAEPLPGDTLEELLVNMRKDLEQYRDNGGDTALQYHDQSPLSRLIKTIGSDKGA